MDISLVLTDISMPIMNGPTFVDELLLRGMPRQIPILFMSGGKAQVPPGHLHIAKPFSLAQLMKTIEQYLSLGEE